MARNGGRESNEREEAPCTADHETEDDGREMGPPDPRGAFALRVGSLVREIVGWHELLKPSR